MRLVALEIILTTDRSLQSHMLTTTDNWRVLRPRSEWSESHRTRGRLTAVTLILPALHHSPALTQHLNAFYLLHILRNISGISEE